MEALKSVLDEAALQLILFDPLATLRLCERSSSEADHSSPSPVTHHPSRYSVTSPAMLAHCTTLTTHLRASAPRVRIILIFLV